MNIVVQCAGRKSVRAGRMRRRDGREVSFVAHPIQAPRDGDFVYAHPDDLADSATTWREELLAYNENPGANPLRLLPAWELYTPSVYSDLKEKYGLKRLYILSAGWGLVPADFLLPYYDITFSVSAAKYKRRGRRDASRFRDFRMLDSANDEPVIFFGGKDYTSLFCDLTRSAKGPRYVFHKAKGISAPDCCLVPYETNRSTNWHYECAYEFMNGRLEF